MPSEFLGFTLVPGAFIRDSPILNCSEHGAATALKWILSKTDKIADVVLQQS